MDRIRKITAYLLLFLVWGNLEVSMAQTSGLPAPTASPYTATTAENAFANLTGCTTASEAFIPASGNCSAVGSGTVTSMSTGSLSPLFTASIATGTTTPALSFSLSNAAQNSVFAGPATGGSGAPSYQTAPTISAANMTSFPTFNQSTTGNAATSTLVESSEAPASSATPTFSIATRYSTIILTANETSFTLASGANGQEKTLTFCQNATGGFTVTPPSNVHGFMTVGTTLSKCSSQHFNYDSAQTAWLSDGPGVINE